MTTLAERWPDDLRVEELPPPTPWRESPRSPRNDPPYFPDVAVGFTDAGAHCAMRAPLDRGPNASIAAVAFALWRADVDDDAIARCVTDLVGAARNFPRVAATWISFEGDGGDRTRFEAVSALLYPAHPIEALLGHPLEPWLGMIRVDADRFDALAVALEQRRFVACAATASYSAAEAVRAAGRRDPDGVIVRSAELVTEDDVQLLISGCLSGFVVGLDNAVRALSPPCIFQPASSIVRTDGLSLHHAQAASSAGWRLWVRCVGTDREVQLDTSIIECYGTVFRSGSPHAGT